MSILIKGMEMPQKCSECLLAKLSPTGESLICNYMLSSVPWDEMPFDCPLAPVTPHGRLIDADALDSSETDLLGNHLVYLVDIDDAPTIIPAEGASD